MHTNVHVRRKTHRWGSRPENCPVTGQDKTCLIVARASRASFSSCPCYNPRSPHYEHRSSRGLPGGGKQTQELPVATSQARLVRLPLLSESCKAFPPCPYHSPRSLRSAVLRVLPNTRGGSRGHPDGSLSSAEDVLRRPAEHKNGTMAARKAA